ncbi:expressed unknown protein [Seminavis robusta]|uniref:Uncharacterized protein n=1 Tax=Seminavis robusta TaxID=568900 RepID=A0A9N8HPL6_9STRA|nr:expressed unknown protein [Seminavis robusta]|eukprot:Sro1190_g250760.1 n/a (133) ;mRNA; f:4131-4529
MTHIISKISRCVSRLSVVSRQQHLPIITTATTSTTYCCRSYSRPTTPSQMPLEPGTPIQGMDFFKGGDSQEPIVALDRNEYPGWVNTLASPLPSLAKLRKMPEEEADDKLKMRYLKLKRRMVIKESNIGRAK